MEVIRKEQKRRAGGCSSLHRGEKIGEDKKQWNIHRELKKVYKQSTKMTKRT